MNNTTINTSLLSLSPMLINSVVGFIMDGNRRWAKNNFTDLKTAYSKGSDIFFMTIMECLKYKIGKIIFYALSSDNFNKRDSEELKIIYDVGLIALNKKKDFFISHKIKVSFIGNRSKLNHAIQESMTNLEKITNFKNAIITIFILIVYDPYKDIFDYHINKKLFYSYAVPNIDLIIRTGGYNRLSGFLPIQSMHSNIITLSELWPDLTKETLHITLKNYNNNKNYGK